jgi:hypothetical protein
MAAREGTRPPARQRPAKGVRNKITRDVKAMILGALAAKGGQAYLQQQADRNPVAFMSLLGKVLPMQIAGNPAEPLQTRWISYGDAEPNKR